MEEEGKSIVLFEAETRGHYEVSNLGVAVIDTQETTMAKYCTVTFLLWMFGGFIGLHHFYLGRDKHGVLLLTSFGGLIIGWLRDFTHLGAYTDEANKSYPLHARRYPGLATNLHRIVACCGFSLFYRFLVANAIPDQEYVGEGAYRFLLIVVAPLGTVFGSYMVCNVGHISCHEKYPIIGAYLGELLFGQLHLMFDAPNILLSVTVCTISCVIGWRERVRKTRRTVCKRGAIVMSTWLIVCGLWLSYGYFNAEVYIEHLDHNVKLRTIFSQFFNSEEWVELKKLLWEAIVLMWKSGGDYERTWYSIQEGVATTQIRDAMDTLGFEGKDVEAISEEELNIAYRALAKRWHPDKVPIDEKERAQETFIRIQASYKLLKKYMKMSQTHKER